MILICELNSSENEFGHLTDSFEQGIKSLHSVKDGRILDQMVDY